MPKACGSKITAWAPLARRRAALMTKRYCTRVGAWTVTLKPGGAMRLLGIPTVLDRFIQQPVLQVLQRYWDETFRE